jgi:hypothetical protein
MGGISQLVYLYIPDTKLCAEAGITNGKEKGEKQQRRES